MTLKEEGHKVDEIIKRCGVSKISVYRVLQRGKVLHQRVYPNGTGRPTLISTWDKSVIEEN